ncbi:MAG TPA: YidC/Oxa1 family membrane protein insertase [Acidimicrobiales bacterium]|nr:YidC/Oxa1 family membrane protein insertase [Acidimicrobiales bacterium]
MTLSAISLSSLYRLMADLMTGCYAVTHNYALAIALLTLATVGLTTPLTWKSSRGMIAMQALQPEMKKIQAKYKGDRVAMNEEMSKLYREAGINPLSGCLPLVPQMVVFYVLYHTIANLSHRASYATRALATAAGGCPTPAGGTAHVVLASGKYTCSDPTNMGTHSLLYQNLVAAGGHMKVFGFDLTLGVRTAHHSALIGCLILVALVVAAQYWQTRQVNRRNPGAAANPQAQMMQRIFPLFFGFISINIQAGVNVYFLVSALCRIGQQSLMFKYDPVLRRQLLAARTGKPVDLPPRSSRQVGGAGRGPAGGSEPAEAGPGGVGPGGSGRRGGGGIARLLGLADPDPSPGAPRTSGAQGRGNLDRFIGSSGGAKGTLGGSSNGNGKSTGAKSTNNRTANGNSPSSNPASNGSGQSRRRGGPAAPSAKHQDRNRSKAKRRRSR